MTTGCSFCGILIFMSKQRRRKKQSNFILPFFITLTFVVLIGLFCMFSYLWIVTDDTKRHSNFQLTKEKIPEEEQVEEIIGQNDNYADILQDEDYMVENNIYAKEAMNEEFVTISFAGDILFDPNYSVMATLLQNDGHISNAIKPDVIAEMESADIMMLNNEFPYTDRGTPTKGKKFTFRASTSSVSYLQDMGVDIVSLANNHSYDYGEQGFRDTLQTLKDARIPYVGAGRNEEEALKPVYYIINNMKIAFVSATQIEKGDYPDTKGATAESPGVFRCWNVQKLLQVVAEAKENSDFVIVYIHWGTENQESTDWAQDEQAPQIVAAGADLIIGNHPHLLQKIDVIDGVPVVYSLGNFWFNSKTIDTGIVKVSVNKEGLRDFQFIPCLQSNCKTTLLTGEEKERVLNKMRSMSGRVQIDTEGYVTW